MASRSRSLERPRPVAVGAGRIVSRVSRMRELGLLVALLAIVVVVSIQAPRFLTLGNLREILLSVAILAIVGVGQTLVILTRNVDLSVGSMAGLSAFLGADMFKHHLTTSVPVVLAVGCLIGVALGAFNGLLVTVGQVPSIVATLGTLYAFRGLDYWIAGGGQVSAYDVPASYLNLATAQVLGVPVLVLFALVIVAIFSYLLRFSRTGRQLYAIGSNPEAAQMMGIRSDLLVFGTFVICGLLSGFAGVLWGSRYGSVNASVGTGFELQDIAAVVVGGVNIFGGAGTIVGSVLGAIVLGTIEDALTILKLSAFWLQAIYGAAILAAVTVDALITRRMQRALFARRQR